YRANQPQWNADGVAKPPFLPGGGAEGHDLADDPRGLLGGQGQGDDGAIDLPGSIEPGEAGFHRHQLREPRAMAVDERGGAPEDPSALIGGYDVGAGGFGTAHGILDLLPRRFTEFCDGLSGELVEHGNPDRPLLPGTVDQRRDG